MILSNVVKAQDLTNYNLYIQNPFLYNPAYSVDKCNLSAYLNSHLQWMGFDGAPRVNTLGIRGNLNSNMGLGLSVYNFKYGIMGSTDLNLSYSYKALFADDHYLRLGISLGTLMDNISTVDAILTDASDPLLIDGFKQTSISAKFGLAYNIKGFEAQIIMPKLYERKALNLYTVGILSYNIAAGTSLDVKPSIMFRGGKTTPKQFDVNFTALYKKMIWGQVGYRSNKSLIFGIGVDIKNYSIGYMYQMENNYINQAGGGTHEIQLVVKFGCDKKEVTEVKNVTINGNVISKSTGKPVTANVLITDSDGKEVFNKEVTGEFTLDLKPGKYTAVFTGNIIPKTETFVISSKDDKVFKLEVNVKEVDANKTFNLGSVNFETSKSVIKGEDSYKVLDELVSVMTEYPTIKIEIQGHTDNVGDDAANLKLSQERADACKTYAISKGIAATRLTAVGYGETKPLVANDTDENKAKNRRVEFKVLD